MTKDCQILQNVTICKKHRGITNDYDKLQLRYDSLDEYVYELEDLARGLWEENEQINKSVEKELVRELKDKVLEGLENQLEGGIMSEGKYLEKCNELKE